MKKYEYRIENKLVFEMNEFLMVQPLGWMLRFAQGIDIPMVNVE